MMRVNAQAAARNSWQPSSEQHAPPQPSLPTSLGKQVVRTQSAQQTLYRAHPWKRNATSLHYWTQSARDSTASAGGTSSSPAALEIHFCNLPVDQAIKWVFSAPSPQPEPDSTSATLTNHSTTADEQAPQEHIPNLSCRKQNQHVIALLEQADILKRTSDPNDSIILSSELSFAAISFILQQSPDGSQKNQARLVKAILRGDGYYGGSDDEAITSTYANQVLRQWIARILFTMPVEDLMVQYVTQHERPSEVSTQTLSAWLLTTTRMLLRQGIVETCNQHPLLELCERWIWSHVYVHTAPMLLYSEYHPDAALNLMLTDTRWARMHAGLLFALQCGFNICDLLPEAAMEAGKILMRGAGTHGGRFDVHAYFQLPVRCTQEQTDAWAESMPVMTDMEQSTLEVQAAADALREQLQRYQTRIQIAEKMIEQHCPGMNIDELLVPLPGQLLTPAQLAYGDPGQRFGEQIKVILKAFTLFDNLMIKNAFMRLPEQEIDFISQASILFAQGNICTVKHGLAPSISIPPLLPLVRMALRTTPVRPEDFFLDLVEGVDIFVSSTPHEQRIYALETHQSGYEIKRIFTEGNERLITGSTISLIAEKQPLDKLRLREITFSRSETRSHFQALLNDLSQQHRYRLYVSLHLRGVDSARLDTDTCVTTSFESLYRYLDEQVKSTLPRLSGFMAHSHSDEESQNHPASTAGIISIQMKGREQPYSFARLSGKQHNNKDIYVQVNPHDNTLYGRKFTLNEKSFLEPVPVEQVQPISREIPHPFTLTRIKTMPAPHVSTKLTAGPGLQKRRHSPPRMSILKYIGTQQQGSATASSSKYHLRPAPVTAQDTENQYQNTQHAQSGHAATRARPDQDKSERWPLKKRIASDYSRLLILPDVTSSAAAHPETSQNQ